LTFFKRINNLFEDLYGKAMDLSNSQKNIAKGKPQDTTQSQNLPETYRYQGTVLLIKNRYMDQCNKAINLDNFHRYSPIVYCLSDMPRNPIGNG
jgi:hypothetical protein